MPSFDDRAAILAALREHIRRLQEVGLIRPPAVSAPEYLRRLGSEGVLSAETAEALAARYETCRFGCASPAAEASAAELAALEAAAAAVENSPEERREALVMRWRRRWTPPTCPAPRPRKAAGGETSFRLSASVEPPGSDAAVELRKQLAEQGPSRVWTILAGTLVVWTVVVMAGSLWQRDRILSALIAGRWGGALASPRQDESAPQDLRAAYAGQRERSGPTNLMLLGGHYARRGDYAEAIQLYHQSLERATAFPEVEALASAKLARVLLTADDPWYHDSVQGIRLASRAVELRPQKWEFLETLAIAQSRIGAYDDAVESARAALRHATFHHHKERCRRQLEVFEAEAAAHAQAEMLANSTDM